MKRHHIGVTLAAASAVLLAACGGGGGGGGGAAPTTAGTLKVALTDAPACGFDHVYVTVQKVRVHKSEAAEEGDGGWSEILLAAPRRIDLLSLVNGRLEDLGQTSLPPGTYNQLRLVLAPNTDAAPLANAVVPSGGAETALVTPSAVQSGIKLNGGFEVGEGATTELALDFDACKSIVRRGNGSFGLKPVIRIIPMAVSGSIDGYVDPAVANGRTTISAQVDGVTVRSTVPASDGSFSLAPLEAGTYAVVATGDSRAADIVGAVPVTAKTVTALATSAAPLLTAPSTAGTLSGKLLPEDAEGTVTAYQAPGGGPTVAIRYSGAELATGDYAMSLPLAAPRYARYGGTLPLGFASQNALAGKYAVRAGAAGYQTRSVDVDLAGSDRVQDFTLVK